MQIRNYCKILTYLSAYIAEMRYLILMYYWCQVCRIVQLDSFWPVQKVLFIWKVRYYDIVITFVETIMFVLLYTHGHVDAVHYLLCHRADSYVTSRSTVTAVVSLLRLCSPRSVMFVFAAYREKMELFAVICDVCVFCAQREDEAVCRDLWCLCLLRTERRWSCLPWSASSAVTTCRSSSVARAPKRRGSSSTAWPTGKVGDRVLAYGSMAGNGLKDVGHKCGSMACNGLRVVGHECGSMAGNGLKAVNHECGCCCWVLFVMEPVSQWKSSLL